MTTYATPTLLWSYLRHGPWSKMIIHGDNLRFKIGKTGVEPTWTSIRINEDTSEPKWTSTPWNPLDPHATIDLVPLAPEENTP